MQYIRAYTDKASISDKPEDPIRFIASTEGLKADGADLRMEDWLLDRFIKHPVILYAHDWGGTNLPIGTGQPSFENRNLIMDVRFDVDDPFAMRVREKTRKGMMGASVGWKDVQRDGKRFNELLEMSVVPMPLDADCLPTGSARALALATEYAQLEDATGEQPKGEADEADPASTQSVAIDQGVRLLDIAMKITEVQLR
jgi:hypothetical protein